MDVPYWLSTNIRHNHTKLCRKKTWGPGFVHPWFRIHKIGGWHDTHSSFCRRHRGSLTAVCCEDETNVPLSLFILSLMFVFQKLKCFRSPSYCCSNIYLFFAFSTRRKWKAFHCINFRLRLKGSHVFCLHPIMILILFQKENLMQEMYVRMQMNESTLTGY